MPGSTGSRQPSALVRAPVAGTIVEARPSVGTSGQVFGGTAKIEAADRKVWIFRHVVPIVRVGDRVAAGQAVATVSPWDDGPEHSHIEIRKTNEGGHVFENMLDPLPFFRAKWFHGCRPRESRSAGGTRPRRRRDPRGGQRREPSRASSGVEARR